MRDRVRSAEGIVADLLTSLGDHTAAVVRGETLKQARASVNLDPFRRPRSPATPSSAA
ncbi:MAG TPA: hypothetical protein VFT45_05755 [Longimicrobium sp.]|nr:hypothetical protein [Longimicrobium sp.]